MRFPKLISEAEDKSGLKFGETDLGGWSAGCGALREILKDSCLLQTRQPCALH